MYKARISGVGGCLPKKIVTNADLSKKLDTDDEWIFSRTGIHARYVATEEESLVSLASKAGEDAIANSGITTNDIDAVIVATTTLERVFPSCASEVQNNLRCNRAFAFDIQAVCAGFVYALSVANSYIISGQAKNILVIGADVMSRIVNWSDRSTCILFGDGAGAVVLSATQGDCGILSARLYSDGSMGNILHSARRGEVAMNGKSVFKHAVEKMQSSVSEGLVSNNLLIDDVDWLVPHQANIRIINSMMQKLNIAQEKVVTTLDKHANTSAASIPLAMREGLENFKEGDIIVLTALGAGLVWGSVFLKW